jgi:hypothetical protein
MMFFTPASCSRAGASGFCPLYALFGISTCPRQPAARH